MFHLPQKNNSEDGQVLILTALLLVALVMVSGFAIDGGFSLYESREAQNAADFAALAASNLTQCGTSNNASVTGAQIQSTVQAMVNENFSGGSTTWTAKYLDSNGSAISGAVFSNSTAYTPPSTACGVSVKVSGTWNTTLTKVGGFNQTTSTQASGALGSGSSAASLAIISFFPYGHHVVYGGSTGSFNVVGSLFSNSMGNNATAPNGCTTNPLASNNCYVDSVDMFQSSSMSFTGTLYTRAPVGLDACFAVAPPSGSANCNHTTQVPAITYSGMQGNMALLPDPLANLPEPSANSNAAAECPGQSNPTTYSTSAVSSGSLNPGVYTNTVTISGNVTFNPCQSNGSTTGPGVYIFQNGLEICPAANDSVTGSDVMLYAENLPPAADTPQNGNSVGYCTPQDGGGQTPTTDSIEIGGAAGSTVTLSGPTTGTYKGITIFQDRNIIADIGLDKGYTQSTAKVYTPDDATINITGAIYDNSNPNEAQNQQFGNVPTGSLCTGSSNQDGAVCPKLPGGIPGGAGGFTSTAGTVKVDGAVMVGGFGTNGNVNITITFDSLTIPVQGGTLHLIF